MRKLLIILGWCGVLVSAQGSLILSEDFNYTDGSLTNVSGGLWTKTSGTADPSDLMVNGNRLQVFSTRSDDANRSLGGDYSSGSLYYSVRINMSSLPGGTSGSYLAALANAAGSSFRDRLFVQTNNAALGHYRIGIANGSLSTTFWGSDLALNTEYTVVVRSDLDTDTTYLWINPVDESSLSINVYGDSSVQASSFAFRQITGIGSSTFDGLRVGTTFADVMAIPEPASMGLLAMGLGLLAWRRWRFAR
jgi:hypothetical protein